MQKTALIWMALSLIVFFVAHYMKLDTKACSACYFLATKLWFIEDAAIASRYTDAIRLQWLFLTFSLPVVITSIIVKIDDVKHGDMKIKVPIGMGSLGLLCLLGILMEFSKEEPASAYWRFYITSIFGASILSFVMFYCVMVSAVFTGLYFKAYIRHFIEFFLSPVLRYKQESIKER
ncbi:MAG: hypothetical protein ACR2RB_14315 [Gammaproteobacteria bacterium]